ALAISSGEPMRCKGTDLETALRIGSVGARRRIPSVPSIGPGITEFTRIPSGPHSCARVRVSISTPALAAHTWDWATKGTWAWGAQLLITEAPGFFSSGQAACST